MEITWRDKTITCEEGTTLFDISKQVEKEYEFPIIVAKVDGVIQELYLSLIHIWKMWCLVIRCTRQKFYALMKKTVAKVLSENRISLASTD